MKIPYKRCTYFLGLLKGPNVEDWVNDQTGILREKLNRRSDPIAKTSETLWDDLQENFKRSYAYTGRIEAAKRDLAKLKMVDSEIDNYIAKFENLLRKAEIPRNEVGVMDKFTDGLSEGLHRSIMRRDDWPTTINEWQEAARREVRRFDVLKDTFGTCPKPQISTREAKWQALLRRRPKKKDESVPMEIDAGWTSKEKTKKVFDRTQLSKEGKCFKCLQTGHIKKDCPEWKGKPPPYKPKVAKLATVMEEPKEELSDIKELARTMATLDDQRREDLFDILINEQGF
jgi:hypothetical protein